MNRFTKYGLALLLAVTVTACDEGDPPPVEPPPPPTPVGTISGSVTIEGTAASGITATLSSGATTTTGSGGNFAFSGVEAGTYTVTISGYPEDATFRDVTQSATIATDGQNVPLNFAGEYVRTSAVVGNVVVADAMMSGGDGQPETLAGVTVTLGGEHAMGEIEETGMDGGFAFTGLRAGTYTVTISDFPEDVSFETVSVEVEVGVNKIGNADFTGHFIRTSAVEGEVIVDDEGRAGVTVTLSGGPSDENFTKTTNADGMYLFEDLRPGDYTVSISDYPVRDYEFAATSQDVSVDLGETGTVDFTGILLRTSGISGGVSVDGMGLRDIAVTLSGAADDTTMTDAGGQYSFTGLAAGDYTVTIAVESNAYVFDSMSQDVTLGDDDPAKVSFLGAHARTASVVGQLFLDELDKNGEQDAGEHPLAHAGIPVTLVGPGVNEFTPGVTGADGRFAISNLRAGTYQLIVVIEGDAATKLAAASVAYGGPTQGYTLDVGVGEREEQDIPFAITHTTVNFTVSLKNGDEMGDALPGAMVTLSSDDDDSHMTGDDGSVAIRVPRAGLEGNMVTASVTHDDYEDGGGGMTEVSWDPQSFTTEASNANDIVNLNVNVNISGATVMTDYGGGEALGGWEIDVMMGDAAVPGAPTALGSDGSVAFTDAVESVPAIYTFTVADDQDDDLDGGEMYKSSGGMYEHDGLSVAGTAMDADPIVVTYTTQTLKVYVHHELDQVMGYTGNALSGDKRVTDELVDIEIEQASGSGGRFTSPIPTREWDANARGNKTHTKGEYTFSHLPAHMNIVVRAEAKAGFKLLDTQRLDTYRDMTDNGVEGSAFGDMGGWGSTVELCRLKKQEPTTQDFDECASFAVVSLHDVTADVSKVEVKKSGNVFGTPGETRQKDITVSLEPVPNKNLAGVARSFTTASSNDASTPEDDRRKHNFGAMAAGSYDIAVTDGWRAMAGDPPVKADGMFDPLGGSVDIVVTPSTATLYGFVRDQNGFGLDAVPVTVNGVTETTDDQGRYIVTGIPDSNKGHLAVSVARAGYPTFSDNSSKTGSTLSAFAANTAEQYDITLSGANNTATITGKVTIAGTGGTPLKDVTILVDGDPPLNATGSGSARALKTRADGTYTAIVAAQAFNEPTVDVTAELDGWGFLPGFIPVIATAGSTDIADFEGREEIDITGTVIAPGGGPMRDVRVSATNQAGAEVGHYVTTETGTFTVGVPALSGGVTLSARPLRLRLGEYGPTTYTTQAEYDALVDADNYVWFDNPTNRPGGQIAVIPGRPTHFGEFTGRSVQPRITSAQRVRIDDPVETVPTGGTEIVPNRGATPTLPGGGGTRLFDLVQTEPTDTIVVTWQYDTRNNWDAAATPLLPYTAEDDDGTGGGTAPTLEASDVVAATALTTPTSFTAPATSSRGSAPNGTTVSHTRTTKYAIPATAAADYGEIDLEIGHNVTGAPTPNATGALVVVAAAAPATGSWEDLPAVDGSIRGLKADRDITVNAGDIDEHEVTATWFGDGSPQLEHRIALLVRVEVPGGPTQGREEWIVFNGEGVGGTTATVAQPVIARRTNAATQIANWARWNTAAFDLNLSSNAGGDWLDDDDPDLIYSVNVDNLRKASKLRVDTRVDGDDWVKHDPVAITPGG